MCKGPVTRGQTVFEQLKVKKGEDIRDAGSGAEDGGDLTRRVFSGQLSPGGFIQKAVRSS